MFENPEACSVCSAVPRSRLETSGTVEVVGPFETVSETTEPFPAEVPDCGLWSITVFAGWSFGTYRVLTLKPAACSVELAWSIGSVSTFGTAIGCGPFETLMRTGWPCVSFSPGGGDWAVTWPVGSVDG